MVSRNSEQTACCLVAVGARSAFVAILGRGRLIAAGALTPAAVDRRECPALAEWSLMSAQGVETMPEIVVAKRRTRHTLAGPRLFTRNGISLASFLLLADLRRLL